MTKEVRQNPPTSYEAFTCNMCGLGIVFRTDLTPDDGAYELQGFRLDSTDDCFHYNCVAEDQNLPKPYVKP